ncbi:type IX secretion system membrane protein PorP/SprF, partial [Fulvivirga sp. RKSG066]|uniref:PorP/SprF family type IX secretion system membrane protein n=1 Tax=Fulvivirga aurantia TaxID=2529383 RepID=UPI0012BBBACE
MKYFLTLLGLILVSQSFSQTRITNHYFLNPAVYNSSFVGYSHYTEIHLNRRQQWQGIEGAPISNAFDLQIPSGRGAFGFKAYNEQNGILDHSSASLTFSYQVPFNVNHGLRFGLSGGAGINSIDLDEVNINDPAVNQLSDNSLKVIGDFGFAYYYKSLYLGFALPHLFTDSLVSQESFQQIDFSPTDNYILSAKYTIELAENRIAFEPNVIYRVFGNNESQFEAQGILTFLNTIWVGGSYRQDYGVTTHVGLNIKDKFSFGFAYELASDQVSGFNNGSHEFHLRLRLGKKKEIKAKEPVDRDVITDTIEEEKQEPAKEEIEEKQEEDEEEKIDNKKEEADASTGEKPSEEKPQKEDVNNQQTKSEVISKANTTEPEVESPEQPIENNVKQGIKEEQIAKEETADGTSDEPVRLKKGKHLLELDYGHYVIVGAFSQFENAENYSDKLFQMGYENTFGYNSQKQLYYVIYSESNSSE